MKRFAIIIACIMLALTVGCASNMVKKTEETIDPVTQKVTKRVTTEKNKTDSTSQGDQQIEYAKQWAKNGIFEIEAAEKTVTDLVYDDKGKVVGKTVTKSYEDIKISGAKRIVVRTPLPKWTQPTEAWERALAKANGWINMLMFGWWFGPQNYDTGTTNYQLATSGNQSPINVGGKQTSLGSNVMNTGEGSASGGDMSNTDSSQQNHGDSRGFGDIGEIF
ncbi:MAG: hypothetical protein KKC30_15730 [Proteobacteria bacterium]|nr:hypothetical protein [Pseudomonadota bacterium]MBU4381583.1 hypothetical protein [Pseudomonadota bacterium]MCG2766569.1 hypothetical protein [Desulfarculaceae bacterium]